MSDPTGALVLELKHTGERLELTRVDDADGTAVLRLVGSLPPQQEGPPLHVHVYEEEVGIVTAGILAASVEGETVRLHPGESTTFPAGSRHRWWNGGTETLRFEGFAKPLVDLDRYLQAVFEVVNAGPPGTPPLFYMAHVSHRHRKTQQALILPLLLQRLLFPVLVAIGTILGKYRGSGWPGCPDRCTGAPKSQV
jgi:quercetin dioxygenase-like cupin family protein